MKAAAVSASFSEAEDGHGAYAVLTSKGRAHFKTAQTHHMELVRREFSSRFTAAELEQLATFWRRFDTTAPKPLQTQQKNRE